MGKTQQFTFTKAKAYFSFNYRFYDIGWPRYKYFIFKILSESSPTDAVCMAFELFSFKETIFFNQSKVYLLWDLISQERLIFTTIVQFH